MQWLLDFYADCERASDARWSGPGVSALEALRSCAAWHVDSALLIPLVVIAALLAARRLGWIRLHPREIVFFVLCLGLAPLYFWAWWKPGMPLDAPVVVLVLFAPPVAALFVMGIVGLIRRRPGRPPIPILGVAFVIFLAFLGHGCVHFVSYNGIR